MDNQFFNFMQDAQDANDAYGQGAEDVFPNPFEIARAQQLAKQLSPATPPVRNPGAGLNIGPIHLGGNGLDNASLAILSQLQNGAGAPRGFGQNFASGLVGGLAGSRVRDLKQRNEDFDTQTQNYNADLRAQRVAATQFATGLARHRWGKTSEMEVTDPELAGVLKVQTGTKVPPATYNAGISALNRAKGGMGGMSDEDKKNADALIQGIKSGIFPPDVTKLGRNSKVNLYVVGRLADSGYDYTMANKEWLYQQALSRTAGGSKQVVIAENIGNVQQSLNKLKELNAEWKRSGYPSLNSLRATIAKGGLVGPDVMKAYNLLQNQVTVASNELGSIYMGGNSPTDQAVRHARDLLQTNWSEDVLDAAADLALENVGYRRNAINQVLQGGGGSPGRAVTPKPGKKAVAPSGSDKATIDAEVQRAMNPGAGKNK